MPFPPRRRTLSPSAGQGSNQRQPGDTREQKNLPTTHANREGPIEIIPASNLCPTCGEPLAATDINLAEGVALCPHCGKLARLRDVADEPVIDPDTLTRPPPGCVYEPTLDGFIATASTRSPRQIFHALFTCLFVNAILSVFLTFALGEVYARYVGPLPHWFPTSKSSTSELPAKLLCLCIFLIPFVTIGCLLFLRLLTTVFGHIQLVVSADAGRIRTGFGPFHWTRKFDASAVESVAPGRTRYAENGHYAPLIEIEADRKVRFGTLLSESRTEWMMSVIYLLLVKRRTPGRETGPQRPS